jgi:arabidopsis histidine kinase 2/3/4 (cytokinin receptor)
MQFNKRGHIFVKVHLAENRKPATNGKLETYRNGGSEEVVHTSGGCNLKTLSGYEAADKRLSATTEIIFTT